MDFYTIAWIALAVFCMSTLYATVGHGGGSGYLAVLAIAAIAPEHMRPIALILNVAVSSIATWKFTVVGAFRKDLFIPLVCASIPTAFIGGLIDISPQIYKPLVGFVLLLAAIRLFSPTREGAGTNTPRLPVVLLSGAIIGFFSGVIGVGGGIFLSPLILLAGWTTAKQTAAISAPFILVNSISGLGGIVVDRVELPIDPLFITPLIGAVLVGGIIGATFGSKKLGHRGLRIALGVVLLFASGKMFLTSWGYLNQRITNEIKYSHEQSNHTPRSNESRNSHVPWSMERINSSSNRTGRF